MNEQGGFELEHGRMLRLAPGIAVGFLLVLAVLPAGCGDEVDTSRRRGCTPEHDAAGTYRFSPTYLDERLLLLEESLRIEERPFEREALTDFVDGMRRAWQDATLILLPGGTFTLTGVVHPEFGSEWRGTWEIRIDSRECKLHLTGSRAELHALLGEGWIIPWAEEPKPGIVLDVMLVRDGEVGVGR